MWLITVYVSPLTPVFRLFFALPIALAVMRWQWRTGVMTAIVASLLLTILVGPTRSVVYLMPYGVLGLQQGRAWCENRSWYRSVLSGTVICTGGLIFQLLLSSVLLGENLWAYLTIQLTSFVNTILDLTLSPLGTFMSAPLWLIQVALVGVILLNSLVYTFTVHLVASLLVNRFGCALPEPPTWVRKLLL